MQPFLWLHVYSDFCRKSCSLVVLKELGAGVPWTLAYKINDFINNNNNNNNNNILCLL
jgi:hypothetical protein